MLNLCVKKFCLCTWQTPLLVQTVILLSDRSCDRENAEYKSQKNIAIFIFCKGSSDRKNMHLRMTMKMKILGAMPASSPSSSDIIPSSLPNQQPSKSSSEPHQPNQVSSRGKETQRHS